MKHCTNLSIAIKKRVVNGFNVSLLRVTSNLEVDQHIKSIETKKERNKETNRETKKTRMPEKLKAYRK